MSQVFDYIKETYPCGVIPYGERAKIAAKFGVSLNTVSTQSSKVKQLSPLELRYPKCQGCGEIILGRNRRFCNDCSRTSVACSACGSMMRLDTSTLFRTGKNYCWVCS